MESRVCAGEEGAETPSSQSMRVLIAGVGYRFMRDLSVGPVLIPALESEDWPAGVQILDLHFGPVHMLHWLEQEGPFDRIVFVGAVVRGRAAGEVHAYQWHRALPDADQIQERVGEGVAGVLDLDSLLVVGEYFQALPADVVVVEVEPEDTGWGDGFSPTIAAALPEVMQAIRLAVWEKTNA
ncbi:MAG: hydrogenase maturation protease [Anaerolineae bacterium]